MKLYQIFPGNTNISMVARACLLATLAYPDTDLLAIRYLLPQAISSQEPVTSILECASLLEACKYDEFWKARAKHDEVAVPGDSRSLLVQVEYRQMLRLHADVVHAGLICNRCIW